MQKKIKIKTGLRPTCSYVYKMEPYAAVTLGRLPSSFTGLGLACLGWAGWAPAPETPCAHSSVLRSQACAWHLAEQNC